MTQEENERRSRDPHVKFIKEHLCDKDKDKYFVFISYKSDDWEVVLHDIVYRLVKDYGLNVYFDGSFDTHNSLWINQFPENMQSDMCVGVLNFVDDKYAASYATLLELMYSQTELAENMNIVPVNLRPLTKISIEDGKKDTRLGVKFYEDGITNVNANSEKELFDETFDELVDRGILRKSKYLYKKKNLTKKICNAMIMELLEYRKVNENYYKCNGNNGELDAIVGSIEDAFGKKVFCDPIPDNNSDKQEENNSEFKASPIEKSEPVITHTGTPEVNTPSVSMQNTNDNDGDIYYYYKAAGGCSVVKKNALGEYCILKGSKMSPTASYGQEVRDKLAMSNVVENGVFQQDYVANSPSQAAKLISGNSVNGKEAFRDRIRITKNEADKILSDLNQSSGASEELYYYYKAAGGYSVVKKNSHGEYCILKGSKMSPAATFGQEIRDKLAMSNVVKDGVFQQDYVANSPSQAAKLICGYSVNGKDAFSDKIKITKEQAESILASLKNIDNQASVFKN